MSRQDSAPLDLAVVVTAVIGAPVAVGSVTTPLAEAIGEQYRIPLSVLAIGGILLAVTFTRLIAGARAERAPSVDSAGCRSPSEDSAGCRSPSEDSAGCRSPSEDSAGCRSPSEDSAGCRPPWHSGLRELFSLGSTRAWHTDLAHGVLLGIGVLATNAFVLVVVGKLFASGYSEAAKGREASLAELAEVPFGLALGTAVFAGIYEEFVFRGFVQDRLRKIFAKGRNAERMGRTRLAIVVSQAALFAVGHGWQGTVGVVHAAVVGALFGVVSAWRGLRMAMAAHVTIDVVSFALLHLAMQ